MFVVGVTGGIGSGKTAATDHFQTLGISVVDADIAARAVVEPGTVALQKIAQYFGSKVITAEGQLDRRQLREIVFADPQQRQWLEQLTHPLIGEEIRQQIQNSQSAYTILASPLLLESQQKNLADRILLIDVPVALQIERTITRDNSSRETVAAIIAAQMPRDDKLKLADDLICNDQDIAYLQQRVEYFHQQYLRLATTKNSVHKD